MVNGLYHGKKICKNVGAIQNSMRQNGAIKQVLDEDAHILDAIVQNVYATAMWCKVSVHSWFIPQTFSFSVYLYSPFKDGSAVHKILASNGMMIVNDKLRLRG
jgi:hypothetical protein